MGNGEKKSNLQWYLGLISIEQAQPAKVLPEFALHANLQQVVLEQNAVVFEDEPATRQIC